MIWPIWERRDFEVSKTSGPLMVTRTSNWSERMWFWMWTIEATLSPFFTMKAFWKILNLLSIILLILTYFWFCFGQKEELSSFTTFFNKERKEERKTDLDEGEGFREDIFDQEREGIGCHDRDHSISRRTSDVGHDAEDISMGLEGRKHEFGLVGS